MRMHSLRWYRATPGTIVTSAVRLIAGVSAGRSPDPAAAGRSPVASAPAGRALSRSSARPEPAFSAGS
jgi:hypothetical protein